MNEAYEVYKGGLTRLLGDSLREMMMWREADSLVGVLVMEGNSPMNTETRRAVSELETSILQETGIHVTTLALPEEKVSEYRDRLALMGGVRRKVDQVRAAYLNRRMKVLLARADKNLTAAEALTEKRLYSIAVSSAYYSAHLAAKALLIVCGEEPEDARRILALFMEHFVKTGMMPRDLATCLAMLYDAHTEAEFRLRNFQRHEIIELLAEARKFLTAARTVLEGL